MTHILKLSLQADLGLPPSCFILLTEDGGPKSSPGILSINQTPGDTGFCPLEALWGWGRSLGREQLSRGPCRCHSLSPALPPFTPPQRPPECICSQQFPPGKTKQAGPRALQSMIVCEKQDTIFTHVVPGTAPGSGRTRNSLCPLTLRLQHTSQAMTWGEGSFLLMYSLQTLLY